MLFKIVYPTWRNTFFSLWGHSVVSVRPLQVIEKGCIYVRNQISFIFLFGDQDFSFNKQVNFKIISPSTCFFNMPSKQFWTHSVPIQRHVPKPRIRIMQNFWLSFYSHWFTWMYIHCALNLEYKSLLLYRFWLK